MVHSEFHAHWRGPWYHGKTETLPNNVKSLAKFPHLGDLFLLSRHISTRSVIQGPVNSLSSPWMVT